MHISGIAYISVEVAEALAKCEGDLSLDGLTSISVDLAAVLAKHDGYLSLERQTVLSNAVAHALSVHGHLSRENLPAFRRQDPPRRWAWGVRPSGT